MILQAILIAQASPAGLPGWLWPLLAGVGTFLATLLSGKIVVPTFAYLREKERADRYETKFEEFANKVDDQTRPAMEGYRLATAESSKAISAAMDLIKELKAELVYLRRLEKP